MLPAGRQGLHSFWLVGLGFCCYRNRSFLQGIHVHAGQRDRPCFLRPCLSLGKKKLLDVPQDLTLFSHLDHTICAIAAFGCSQTCCRSRDLIAEDAERNRRVQLTELTAPPLGTGDVLITVQAIISVCFVDGVGSPICEAALQREPTDLHSPCCPVLSGSFWWLIWENNPAMCTYSGNSTPVIQTGAIDLSLRGDPFWGDQKGEDGSLSYSSYTLTDAVPLFWGLASCSFAGTSVSEAV